MTIKRRLFLSNILMIAIPAVLSVLALAAGLLLLTSAAAPNAGYRLLSQHELGEAREELAALAADWLKESAPGQRQALADRIEQVSARNQMVLLIEQDGAATAQFGDGDIPGRDRLEQSLAALDGIGLVSDRETDLFGAQLTANGGTYQMKLYNPVISLEDGSLKRTAVFFGLFVVGVALLAVLLTNRFLTCFVFQHISGPLHTLAEGVRQIRDGNLAHRIAYGSQDEFQPICEDFNDMAARLRASVEQSQKEEEGRKELLASISHDIRSPLTSIRAYVEGLLDGVADTGEKQRAYLSIVRAKTMEIDEMVKKLFLFSKMDMGEYPYAPEKLNAGKEVGDFVRASKEEYRRRGLEVTVGYMPEDAIIEVDGIYFRSILMNLLDNSAKYRNQTVGQAYIAGKISGQNFVLSVDDDGPGVPEAALPKLFDVFYRSEPSRNNPQQGSGLGLAIVAKSAARMGGAIHAENLPGGGLRMTLQIPLAEGGEE